ncbi:hypothetical protein PanWU01x14_203190 [Parasponia andersonii]|uniref:Uncharacterized protein n=1 Tax=Parasponia andersonii TaxID=3476 RepID=A0A2P5BWZ7_PARAD|nr:hypothetical protein PanWU01x14_203190 [Parasponia andersonii]
MVYAKLTKEEKANYGDVEEESGGPEREICDGESDLKCSHVMKWIRSVGGFISPKVKLLYPRKEKSLLCVPEDVKKKKDGPMKLLKKDASSALGFPTHNVAHSPQSKGKDELMILKDEIAIFRFLVVSFPDHVDQMVEMEAEKKRKAIIKELSTLVRPLQKAEGQSPQRAKEMLMKEHTKVKRKGYFNKASKRRRGAQQKKEPQLKKTAHENLVANH